MGLKSEIQTNIASAFDDDLSDAVKTFVYYDIKELKYASGSAGGEVISDYEAGVSGRGVFSYTDPTRKDHETDILEDLDMELLILQNEIDVTSFEIDSHIVSTNYGTLRIAKVIEDPAGSTWTLYLSRIGK